MPVPCSSGAFGLQMISLGITSSYAFLSIHLLYFTPLYMFILNLMGSFFAQVMNSGSIYGALIFIPRESAIVIDENPISAHISCCFFANSASDKWNCHGYPKSSSNASPVKVLFIPLSLKMVKPM